MMDHGPEEADLLRQAAAGSETALNQLFTLHRERLYWMVQFRLNRRLQGRIDASDVLQEAYLETCKRLQDYLRNPRLPFFLWLRQITGVKLLALHRQHLGTQKRDARHEVALPGSDSPEPDARALAAQLVGRSSSVSSAAQRAELQRLVHRAIEALDPLDREVITLRHFEMLTNEEAAQVLGLKKSAASNRYVRALRRLKAILTDIPGFFDED